MKSIYNKSVWVIGLLLILGFGACTNDLDTTPPGGKETTADEAWEDESTYNKFVAKIYGSFALSGNQGPNGYDDIAGADQGEATFLRSYWNLQELPTDEAVCAWSDDGLDGLMFCQWTSSNRFAELSYNRMLVTIAFCNEFMRETEEEKLDARGVDNALKATIHEYRAEVRALRAMNYYFLMDLFANVPFVTPEDGVGAFLPEQKGRDFFFPWIESELKACEGQLPEKTEANYGKVTDEVVWMVLAKMYLNAEVYVDEAHYTDCLSYLNKLLEANYGLDDKYSYLFGADNHVSSEIIFPVIFDGKKATSYGGMTYLMAAAWGSDMEPGSNFGLAQSWSGLRAKETLSTLFETDDARAMFWTDKRTQETQTLNDFNSGYSVIKFTNILRSDPLNVPVGERVFGSDSQFPDADFPMYRLADAYLMYAECVLRGGEGGSISTALGLVNEIRTRAHASTIGEADLTLDFMLQERARELYWEGHRRTDLIRFNRFTANYTWPWKNGVYSGTASISKIYKLFPIPATELVANPNIKQNMGY
ncbi:RagB/SusD family nutrient uptake outer membrane protein [Carboxylicivirga sp. A043]|uniref:RagB/SusD family nutrient uptake outer membrane protein n=1 Tax=Carboxylicivirga litoralis TaxID=2816963 RepID=UPI0021CB0DF9|nr:RagB/SusD family nutrient uptake outer membrane protein [Carboxylicivirga sp. A043]MCU4155649.1 RagB/SusD family nutrient uptake outer membrane protein [Carboxylicivirga sp. A043]